MKKPNLPELDRRNFVRLAAAATVIAGTRSAFAQSPVRAKLSFGHKPVAIMPLDFMGVSYESPQLMNPAFFSPANTGLVELFRKLSPAGVLRTGGNLSAFTGWRDDPSVPLTAAEQAGIDKGKKYWEWDLTDPTIRHGNHEAVFTPACIETLAGFLQATGWKLIYGLNFGTGTPEQAAKEAACVQRLCGKNLLAFQLGNELDFWNGGLRPKGWDFDVYYAQWKQWVSIIRAAVPGAPFGGPDVAIRLDWMEKMAEREKNDIVLLSKHHYAMGPAGDPRMDATHLLGPDPDVAKEIASAQRAKAFAGVGFRTTECGSCYHGGQPGVSDAFVSALWGADYALTLAQGGHAGVNFHGGGNGFYSPIVGDPTQGIKARPLYYGMQFAQAFAGAALLETNFDAGGANATAFAAHRGPETLVAIVNKSGSPMTIAMGKGLLEKTHAVARLSAPALDSLSGVTLNESAPTAAERKQLVDHGLDVPAYSAALARITS